MDYNHTRKGEPVTITPGAHLALIHRGWERGVKRIHDGESSVVAFEWGEGRPEHHLAVLFADGEQVGFPLDMVEAPNDPSSPTAEAGTPAARQGGEGGGPEAAGVTAGAVGFSAWLGDVGDSPTKSRYLLGPDGLPVCILMLSKDGRLNCHGDPNEFFRLGSCLHPVPQIRLPKVGECQVTGVQIAAEPLC